MRILFFISLFFQIITGANIKGYAFIKDSLNGQISKICQGDDVIIVKQSVYNKIANNLELRSAIYGVDIQLYIKEIINNNLKKAKKASNTIVNDYSYIMDKINKLQENNTTLKTTCDLNGLFYFNNISNGDYKLIAIIKHKNYNISVVSLIFKDIEIKNNKNLIVNLVKK